MNAGECLARDVKDTNNELFIQAARTLWPFRQAPTVVAASLANSTLAISTVRSRRSLLMAKPRNVPRTASVCGLLVAGQPCALAEQTQLRRRYALTRKDTALRRAITPDQQPHKATRAAHR